MPLFDHPKKKSEFMLLKRICENHLGSSLIVKIFNSIRSLIFCFAGHQIENKKTVALI